jgi:Spy/CpxP family protein refolding chaperone
VAVLAGQQTFGFVTLADPAQPAGQLGAAPNPPAGRQAGPGGGRSGVGPTVPGGFEWWRDAEVKRELKLTEDKARKIEGMFAKLENDRRPLVEKLDQERARLDQMTRERTADEAAYALQVGQVETLWARWRESRTVMIYRMYRELQPEQYKKLQEIFQRRAASDGRGRGPGR